jgi:hypothetical protein
METTSGNCTEDSDSDRRKREKVYEASQEAPSVTEMIVVDWGTVIPAGITAVVGLAGIGGTLLAARITGRSEDNRAKVAEKRRIYANCLAALSVQYEANILKVETSKLSFPQDLATIFGSSGDLDRAAMNAVFEVQLIASFDVAKLAAKTLETLFRATPGSERNAWATAIALLVAAMRTDLGEPIDS